MRPTREGGVTPRRPGLVFQGYGVAPEVVVEDPEPPTDRLDENALAYIPVLDPPSLGDPTDLNLQLGTDSSGGGTKPALNPTNANDGNTATIASRDSYYNPSGTDTWYIVADLGSAQQVDEVVARGGFGNSGEGNPNYVLWWSDDGSSWTQPTQTPTWDSSTSPKTYTIAIASLTHRYWRLGQIVTWTGLIYPLKLHTWQLNGPQTVDPTEVRWFEAPETIDGDDATSGFATSESVAAADDLIWRGTLADSYLLSSLRALIGFETAGAVTVTLYGATLEDYSDAVALATDTLTATGSLTGDEVAMSWSPDAVYRYWQLGLDAADGVQVYEVELYDPVAFTGAHPELTGRDEPEQHPADAVTYDNTYSGLVADEVQAAIDELAAGAGGGSIIVEETDGTPSVDPTTTIRFPPDTVTDEGSGVVSIRQAPTGFIGARVNNSSSTVSASNVTWTIMTFSTEDYDSDGFHSTSSNTGRHTVPAGLGGKYLLNGGLSFATNSTGQRGYRILKNGSDVIAGAFMNAEASGSVPTRMTFSTVAHLVAGDYVEVQGWHNVTGGGALNMGGDDDYTWWAASKLDSGKVGEGIGCSLYSTATQSITNGADVAVTFGAERFDSDGFHSTSSNTSRVTIPPGLGGKYLVTGAVTWASNTSNGRFCRVRKNGTTNLGTGAQNNSPPTGETAQEFVQVVDLVAGDYVELIVFHNISGGGALNIGSTNDYQYSRLEVMRLDSGSRNTEIVPRVVQQFTSVVATPLAGTVPQAASDSIMVMAFGSVATPRAPSSITQTNVTWTALLGSASGSSSSDARVDLWIGIPTGTPGTSVSVALAAGATNCTGVYYELPRSLSLAGTLDQHVERNGSTTAATSQLTGLIKPTARNFGVYICAVANGTFLIQGYGPFINTTDPITFGGFLDVGHQVCEVTPAHHLRASIPVQTSARWANLIADII